MCRLKFRIASTFEG